MIAELVRQSLISVTTRSLVKCQFGPCPPEQWFTARAELIRMGDLSDGRL